MSTNEYFPEENTTQNINCKGNIMLEPRLQEYMKKRKYYKKNDILPIVSLEKEFSITNVDKKLLKEFLRGNTNVYKQDQYERIISEKKKERSFPSSTYKEDPRVIKIEKQNMDVPLNRGMFVPDKKKGYYEDPVKPTKRILDGRDFTDKNFKGFDIGTSRFNPTIDPRIDPGPETHDKCNSQYRIGDGSVYDSCAYSKKDKPKGGFPNNVNPTDPHETYLNLDLLDEYVDNMDRIQEKPSKKKIKEHPDAKLFNKLQRMDTKLESELIRGMPSMRPRNRSYGYRDVFENQFDYIDPDFQNPDNTDLWARGGEATRIDNKMIAKNRTYVREVM